MIYVEPPLNFTGSKYKILDQIIPHLDYTKDVFIDLFVGGGSVYSNVIDKFDKIIINDIIHDLVDIHKNLILNSTSFVADVVLLSPDKDDKDEYLKLRESYNNDKSADKLYALMLSSTNNMMRFNKKFKYNQTFGKRSFNSNTYKKIDLFTSHLKSYRNKLDFRYGSFIDIDIVKNGMYYIDPPYSQIKNSDGTPSNKKISEAGYNAYYSKQDDINLRKYCIDIDRKGASFMLSGVLEHNGNVAWLLDKLISDGFNWKEIDIDYYKVSRKKEIDKKSKEIIIYNYGNNKN